MAPSRPGFTLLESIVATTLFTLLVAVSLQMLASVFASRRSAEQRAVAIVLAANAMEQIAALPVARISTEEIDALDLNGSLDHALPGSRVKVSIERASSPLVGKKVSLEITWPAAAAPQQPVRLAHWFFQPAGESP